MLIPGRKKKIIKRPPKTFYTADLSFLQYSIKFRATFRGI